MTAVVSTNRKYLMSGALIAVVAVSAYGLGRVYPPLGPAEGTIAPAERYVSSQVQSGDVTLGDTSVPQLMQTDAFEVMTKDPQFAAMLKDPAFAVLASNPAALASMAANARQFAQAAQNPQLFAQLVKQAQSLAANGQAANGQSAQLLASMAANARAFEILGKYPEAVVAM